MTGMPWGVVLIALGAGALGVVGTLLYIGGGMFHRM